MSASHGPSLPLEVKEQRVGFKKSLWLLRLREQGARGMELSIGNHHRCPPWASQQLNPTSKSCPPCVHHFLNKSQGIADLTRLLSVPGSFDFSHSINVQK